MIYAVGDIHGHYRKLVALLDELPLEPDDLLIFVGDYIDRGPDSRRVLDLLIDLREQRNSTIFLRGNHEQMMMDARDHLRDIERVGLWFGNGGDATVDSYPKEGGGWVERIPDEHWAFIESAALEYREGAYIFVHAGLLPKGCRWPYVEDPRLWIREDFLECDDSFGSVVVFGHTPQRSGRPLVRHNMIGIDTGAAYGGPLTAVALDKEGISEPKFYQSIG